jgi:hypothetical protein
MKLECFAGLMSRELLPFFWRATALAPAAARLHEAAKRMLLDAGVLLEVKAPSEAEGMAEGTAAQRKRRRTPDDADAHACGEAGGSDCRVAVEARARQRG